METVESPNFKVIFAGKDITQDITSHLINVSYKDAVSEESDEFTFTVEDVDGLWKGPWYPTKGDKAEFFIGFPGGMMNCGKFTVDEVECTGPPDIVTVKALAAAINTPVRTKVSQAYEGQTLRQIAQTIADKHGYEIVDGETEIINRDIKFDDEKRELAGLAGRIAFFGKWADLIAGCNTCSSLARRIRQKGRTSVAKLLQDAANEVIKEGSLPAAKTLAASLNSANYDGVGDKKRFNRNRQKMYNAISEAITHLENYTAVITKHTSVLDGITVGRVTQKQESDLEFLARVAKLYGIVFTIRDTKIIFTSIYDMENGHPVLEIYPSDLMRYSMKDKATKSYKSAKIRYLNPKTNKLVAKEVQASDIGVKVDYTTAPDVLEIRINAENLQQAEEKARAMLHQANTKNQEGSFTVPGNPLLVAGANFILKEMGGLSGKWHIKSSTHTITNGGYTTEIEAKRIDATSGIEGLVIGEEAPDRARPGVSFKEEQDKLRDILSAVVISNSFLRMQQEGVKVLSVAKRLRNKGKESAAKKLEAAFREMKKDASSSKEGNAVGLTVNSGKSFKNSRSEFQKAIGNVISSL